MNHSTSLLAQTETIIVESANTQHPAWEATIHPLDNKELVDYLNSLSPLELLCESQLAQENMATRSLQMERLMSKPNAGSDSMTYGFLLADYTQAREILGIIRSLTLINA